MINRWLWAIASLGLITACSNQSPAASASAPALSSGIDKQYIDDGVRAQDDLYGHVNGKWLATAEIPADKGDYDQFVKVFYDTHAQLRALVDGLQQSVDPADPDQRKIADLYATFMDEAGVEPLGVKPLAEEFARIQALKDRKQIPSLIAH